jgi:hypothetical protein
VLAARPRTEQNRAIQPYVSGNPREEVAYGAFGVWIQEFHGPYIGRIVGARQSTLNPGNRRGFVRPFAAKLPKGADHAECSPERWIIDA